MAGAPIGNQNALKLRDSDLRKKAYKQYCEWLARGKSQKSFTFVEVDLMCTYRTIESYMKTDPIDFPSLHMELAKCKGYAEWEQVVEDSARGINKDANTASLQMLMRNKFDWDKTTMESSASPKEFDATLNIVKPPVPETK